MHVCTLKLSVGPFNVSNDDFGCEMDRQKIFPKKEIKAIRLALKIKA